MQRSGWQVAIALVTHGMKGVAEAREETTAEFRWLFGWPPARGCLHEGDRVSTVREALWNTICSCRQRMAAANQPRFPI